MRPSGGKLATFARPISPDMTGHACYLIDDCSRAPCPLTTIANEHSVD